MSPTATIARPKDGSSYKLEQSQANYKCADKQTGIAAARHRPGGANVDTSSLGAHTFTVTANDRAGNVTTRTSTYTVRPRH